MGTRYTTEKLNLIVENVGKMMTQSKEDVIKFRDLTITEEAEIIEELNNLKTKIDEILKKQKDIELESEELKESLTGHTKAHSIRKSHSSEEALKVIYHKLANLTNERKTLEKTFNQHFERRELLERSLTDNKKRIRESFSLIQTLSTTYAHLMNDIANLSEIISDKQNTVLKVLKAQEFEKQYIARELHDGVVQTLAQLSIETRVVGSLLDKGNVKQAKINVDSIGNTLNRAITESRELIFNLKPMALDDIGLISTLEQYLSGSFTGSKFNIEFIPLDMFGKSATITDSLKLVIFRAIQESVNNAIKHSKGNTIKIKLEFMKENVDICIKDNGIGFDKNKEIENSLQDNRFGIIGMIERIDMVGGQIDFVSTNKKGTEVRIQLPYEFA